MDKQKASDYLAKLRKDKGLLQSELAEMIHVSPQAVSKWETGESLPDIDSLERLSAIYGITINQILSGGPSEEGEEKKETVDNKDKRFQKNSLFSIIFGGVYFVLALILGAVPIVAGGNAYQLVFSNAYMNGNVLLLLCLFVLIALCTLSIVMGVAKTEARLLYVVRLVLSYLNFAYFTCFFIMFCSIGSAGIYLFEIIALVSSMLIQFLKVAKTSVKNQAIDNNVTVSISSFVMGAMLFVPMVFSDVVGMTSIILFLVSALAFIGLGFMGLFSKKKLLFSILRYVLLAETLVIPGFFGSCWIKMEVTYPFIVGVVFCSGYLIYILCSKTERTYGFRKQTD